MSAPCQSGNGLSIPSSVLSLRRLCIFTSHQGHTLPQNWLTMPRITRLWHLHQSSWKVVNICQSSSVACQRSQAATQNAKKKCLFGDGKTTLLLVYFKRFFGCSLGYCGLTPSKEARFQLFDNSHGLEAFWLGKNGELV